MPCKTERKVVFVEKPCKPCMETKWIRIPSHEHSLYARSESYVVLEMAVRSVDSEQRQSLATRYDGMQI